ncbi:DUF2116 family Zn-ribbon domain-containing protein [Methanococcus voltae]|uniref:DUF2116 family Zn-ribbon domain-containing protein n=1 Tax=Methanococcus voltae (strain ATCC BAA-1334 / A3) TaxID=456320 RepID=D7DR63_METV3|nr:DUF2116 family Zn-ribbon domain-containing protein [Methanococcus voltae]MCS3901000.1 putative nucleic acid-binding Zn ribbon protein [Methanococcus voltae]
MEQHKHCINCGISIPPEEDFCSTKCKEEFAKRRKKMLRSQLLMFGAFVIVFGALILSKYMN